MMGTKARLFTLLPSGTLEDLVPADHFYRHLDRTLNLAFVRDLVQECYATSMGRPSVDPVVFFKLHLVMFFEGVRSERALLRLAADRLSVLWYLGYNLDDPVPDHSSLTRIRARYGVEVFRRFFDAILEQCQQAGLLWGRELYFDSTEVQANAALSSLTPRFAVEARERREATQAVKAVEAHLEALFADVSEEAAQRAHQPPQAHPVEPQEPVQPLAPPPPPPPPPPTSLPVPLPEELQEELAVANAERHDWVAELGAQDRRQTRRGYARMADYLVSTTDPDATMMHTKGPIDMGYHAHFVVDGGKARIIHTVLVTPSEVMDNLPMLDLLGHTRFRRNVQPHQVTGDKQFGTEDNLVAIEAQGIRAYIPQPDLSHRTAFFGADQFSYDATRDVYVCPAGKELHHDLAHSTERVRRYRAWGSVCNACALKAQCTTSEQGRTLSRSMEEDRLERVRGYASSAAYQKAVRKRQVWVEPLVGEGKQWHGLRRFRLRRLWRVNTEALLIGPGLNLKRLLRWRGWGRRLFPGGAALAANQPESVVLCFALVVVEVRCTRQLSLPAAERTLGGIAA
jgi:transposase